MELHIGLFKCVQLVSILLIYYKEPWNLGLDDNVKISLYCYISWVCVRCSKGLVSYSKHDEQLLAEFKRNDKWQGSTKRKGAHGNLMFVYIYLRIENNKLDVNFAFIMHPVKVVIKFQNGNFFLNYVKLCNFGFIISRKVGFYCVKYLLVPTWLRRRNLLLNPQLEVQPPSSSHSPSF